MRSAVLRALPRIPPAVRNAVRRSLPRLLPAACFGAAIAAWLFLYARFLRSFYYSPNPFLVPLSVLQWLTGFTAAILALARVRREQSFARRAWFLLALALTLWPLADGLEQFFPADWTVLQNLLPRPAHLLAYAFALGAVFFFAPVPRARFGRLRFLVDLIIHAASWGVILWFLMVEPILQPLQAGQEPGFWVALYAILDLILLMLTVWLQGQSARASRMLWLLAGGFFLLSIHDMVTGWIVLQGGTQAYVYTGFLMVGGYALIGAAAAGSPKPVPVREAGSLSAPAADSPEGFRSRWRRIEERWLPLVSTAALAVFLVSEWRHTGEADPLFVLATAALALLLFLREGIIAGQAEVAGYAVLLENLEDPAFICDGEGRVLLDNPSLRNLQAAAGAGGRLSDLLPVSPEWDFLLREARAQGWGGEVWVTSSARGSFPAWLVVQRLPGEEGRRERYAALLHDLSPQRRQEESLREAYRQTEESRQALEELSGQLEEKVVEKTADLSRAMEQLEEQNRLLRSLDRLKSEFVALTSHELRTPLMGIRGGLELMAARRRPLPADVRANLDLARKETERLSRFVENILDLSAMEAGRMPLQIGPLRPAEALERARTALAAAHGGLDGRDLRRLEIRLPKDLPEVAADEHILASVFFQLLDNAFKYAPEGPVKVTAAIAPGGVEVVVADRGPGVPPGKREQLFQMFSRLEDRDSPRVRGVGLGLYISRKMVEAMGGSIDVLPSHKGLALRVALKEFSEG
jgi:signal transduction histidine kinase